MKNVEARLSDLAGSKKYREDFERIKREIAKAKHKFMTVEKDYDEELSAKELSRMIEEGSLNYEDVAIHPDHEWFAERYALDLYFDPDHDHPDNFNPFQPPVLMMEGKRDDDTMTVRIDRRAPIKTEVKKGLAEIGRAFGVRHGRDAYGPEEIRMIRDLWKRSKSEEEIAASLLAKRPPDKKTEGWDAEEKLVSERKRLARFLKTSGLKMPAKRRQSKKHWRWYQEKEERKKDL